MGTHHAKDVRTGKLPDVLDKLLKPAPRLLRLLDRGLPWCARLVFGKLGADQVKNRGYSFPDLDAIGLPGVPVLDQLVEVFLSIDLKHCNKKPSKRSVQSQEEESCKQKPWNGSYRPTLYFYSSPPR